MDKRLAKRHKRQVTRAKQNLKVSEPDMRTPEQIKAAREASRAPSTRVTGPSGSPSQPMRNGPARGTGSSPKTAI